MSAANSGKANVTESSVYMDHAATTPLHPRAFEAMLPFLTEHFGNASSVHRFGRRARGAIEDARARIASQLGAEPAEIVFTSGATEANVMALLGVEVQARHIVTSAIEHESVLKAVDLLRARHGWDATRVAVDTAGRIDEAALATLLKGDIGIVSVMYANNEVGTVQSVENVAEMCRVSGTLYHTDAVQAAGYYPIDVRQVPIDLMSFSSHKFHGPKGAGFLFVRSGTQVNPMVVGGGQERNRRAGTENVASIVGMAAALEVAAEERSVRSRRLNALKDRLRRDLLSRLGSRLAVNTPDGESGAPHILNVTILPAQSGTVDGEMLLMGMDLEGVAVSSGSACSSGTVHPSHVLLAMGRSRQNASAAIRLSMAYTTTDADIDRTVEALVKVVDRTS